MALQKRERREEKRRREREDERKQRYRVGVVRAESARASHRSNFFQNLVPQPAESHPAVCRDFRRACACAVSVACAGRAVRAVYRHNRVCAWQWRRPRVASPQEQACMHDPRGCEKYYHRLVRLRAARQAKDRARTPRDDVRRVRLPLKFHRASAGKRANFCRHPPPALAHLALLAHLQSARRPLRPLARFSQPAPCFSPITQASG